MKRILIAEDEKPMSYAMELKFKKAGYGVDVAYDGDTTLDKLENEKYDLVFLDILMPGKNGFEILEHIKDLKVTVPIVITSNLSQKEDIDRAKKLGAHDFLVKSTVTLDEIVDYARSLVSP